MRHHCRQPRLGDHPAGGHVLGIIPEFLIEREGVRAGAQETIRTDSLHARRFRVGTAASISRAGPQIRTRVGRRRDRQSAFSRALRGLVDGSDGRGREAEFVFAAWIGGLRDVFENIADRGETSCGDLIVALVWGRAAPRMGGRKRACDQSRARLPVRRSHRRIDRRLESDDRRTPAVCAAAAARRLRRRWRREFRPRTLFRSSAHGRGEREARDRTIGERFVSRTGFASRVRAGANAGVTAR
jgi:hypothetical protein